MKMSMEKLFERFDKLWNQGNIRDNEELDEVIIEICRHYWEDRSGNMSLLKQLFEGSNELRREKRIVLKYSFILGVRKDIYWMRELLNFAYNSSCLTWQNLYYIFLQAHSMSFNFTQLSSPETQVLRWKLLDLVYERMKAFFGGSELCRFPEDELNKDFVVVITEQFLGEGHGPTKTAMDRCDVLTRMGKNVLLINTAEMPSYSFEGAIPFFDASVANYLDGFSQYTGLQVRSGNRIDFFQCDREMPDINVMSVILENIMELKPYMVFCIGGVSLLAGLVNEVIPVCSIGLTQSGCNTVLTDYQTVEEGYISQVEKILPSVSRPGEHIIPARFTFSLKKQEYQLSRRDFGFEKQDFVMAAVGGRLDKEVTEEFIGMLGGVLGNGIKISFFGVFDRYKNILDAHPELKDNFIYKGFANDMLACMDLCDLYVNPLRKGGATSAVEAMFKGVPVVTLDYGDVAGVSCREFICKDYNDMAERILQYRNNRELYEEHSVLAKKQAELLMDSETEFKKVIDEYMKRR